MAGTYPLPRDRDGRIITGDLLGTTVALAEGEPETPPPAPPAEPPPPPARAAEPAPVRRVAGVAPTPFGQLAGAGAARTPAGGDWRQWVSGAAVLALLLAAAWYALTVYQAAPAAALPPAAAATPAPATTAAATPAAPSPVAAPPPAATAAPAPLTLARAVVAYDAPGGQAVGALEPGRAYTVLDERDPWRLLDVAGSGPVWVQIWEMDGTGLPTAVPAPAPDAPAPAPRRTSAPVVVQEVGPPITCVPVLDGDNGNAYLGDACGATSAERQATALALLEAAPPPPRP